MPASHPKSPVRVVTHIEVLKLVADGGQVVDVLPEHEYRAVHIRGAIHLPLARVLDQAERILEKDKPTVVYCRDSL